MRLFELKQERERHLDAVGEILTTAENAKRTAFTANEQTRMDAHNAEVETLNKQIAKIEDGPNNSLARMFKNGGWGVLDAGSPEPLSQPFAARPSAMCRTREYMVALHSFLKTGGKAHGEELTAGADGAGGYYVPNSERYTQQRRANGSVPGMGAAMYEGAGGGSDAAGGYAVSIPTVQQIVPLAMPDLGIFDAAMVIPTATDVKIPQQASFGTSALKAESSGTVATFGGSDPTLGQIDLSAFMAGALRTVGWELLQDVEVFQQFVVDDLLKGQRILEGQLFATGSGSSQPQGVFGNTGTGTGSAYAVTGTASTDSETLLNALFDVTSTLKGTYQANAAWIMSRATGLAIRKAQMQANLFAPIVTMDPDGTERILGKPVFYDVNAPALPTATTAGVVPILYGDFKAGYIIGVRGGAGINVKILDQPWAAQGQLGILAYRRLDARVRRSEAMQAVTFSHA